MGKNYNGTQISQSVTVSEVAGATVEDCRNKIFVYDENGKAILATGGTKPFIGVALIEAGINDMFGEVSGKVEAGDDIDIQIKDIGSGQAVQAKVGEMKARVNQQVLSRGTRAVNQLRNAELEVLRGKGSGRTYRKYPYKSTYQASAPGEPPARRTGNLRLHWTGNVKGGGGNITLELESAEFYAGYLENGTRKMARRPFKDRITQKALPPIKAIFNEPYL